MTIHLGVLGADDSVAIIEAVASEYTDIRIIPVVYTEEHEITDKITPYLGQADMWLCSGQVPYTIVKDQVRLTCPVFYTRHSGEGLYKTLLYFAHEKGIKVSQMSFDTLSNSTIDSLLSDVGIQSTYHLKHYKGSILSHELADYHTALFEQGVTKVAITCLRSAELQLKQRDVPSVHITPTASEVRQVMDNIIQTQALMMSREGQIVVQIIQYAKEQADDALNSDALHAAIHRYIRALHGTGQEVEPGTWRIYATRGALAEMTNGFTERSKMEDELFCVVASGIGIGHTIKSGEERANFALQQALLCGTPSWMYASEDNCLHGPLGNPEHALSYAYARDDLHELSQAVSLSALTLTKLVGVLDKRDSKRITAHELSEYLHVLPRSARRILLLLEKHDLARVVGEETPYHRGRPRKIYEICLPSGE